MNTQRVPASVCLIVFISAVAHAQQIAPAVQTGGAVIQKGGPVVPLEVLVVISKYQGEKRVSTVPYVLAVNANSGPAQLTIGSDVPIPSTTFTPRSGDDKTQAQPQPIRSYSYKNIGTLISASAQSADDGRFELDISIDESSVGTNSLDGQGQPPLDMPVFKNFKTRNKILLRSGQSRQYTAATDRVSGETVRIEVTLTVVK